MKMYTLVFLLCAVCVGVDQAREIKRKKLWSKDFNNKDLYTTGNSLRLKRKLQAPSASHLNGVFDLDHSEIEKLDASTQASFIKTFGKKIWKKLKQSKRKLCKSSNDCNPEECCVHQKRGINKYCKRRHRLGQNCNPLLLPGISHECPCRTGLTCALYEEDSQGYQQYQCVHIPKLPVEAEAIFSKL